jgi:phosphoglucosamine mutase
MERVGRLFGTDGIRGVANRFPMTAEMAMKVGRAITSISRKEGHTPRILIGHDTRLSGYLLENAIVAGVLSMGGDALLVGTMPTPGVSYLARSMRADAGIVISASHNPYQDNGIKIFSRDGFKLPDAKEDEIEELLHKDDLAALHPEPSVIGKAYRFDDARGRYVVFLKNSFPAECSLEGMKIVLDCSNGATYRIAPETFFELGAEVVSLFTEPDGRNINRSCGSQHPETLAAEVVKQGAQVGFAFDGDGDRVIAVDEKGGVLTGDQMMTICAASMKKQGRLKNDLVISTVMSNIGFGLAIKGLGIRTVTADVGDRYVLKEMLGHGAILGGEDSGHLIFLDHHTTGDGIISAIQLLKAMKSEGRPLSELSKIMKIFPQKLVNVDVSSKPEIETIPEVMNAIREVEAELGEKGRVLVRYSGTQQMCRVMVEAPSREQTETCCKKIADVVSAKIGKR